MPKHPAHERTEQAAADSASAHPSACRLAAPQGFDHDHASPDQIAAQIAAGEGATRDAAASCRLAVYGTLAPGRSNHHQLAALRGRWIASTVRGDRHEGGWGASYGFPGLVLNVDGGEVAVDVLCSDDLPNHWTRLDAFEGEEYRRVVAQVTTAEGPLEACIYVLAQVAVGDPS